MGVEHLQQLNVRGDKGDEVAPVLALQLGGAQPPQGLEDLLPQQRQQLKGDEVVAGLLPIAQEPPGHRKHQHPAKQQPQGEGNLQPQRPGQGVSPQHGEEGGAQMPHQPQQNGQHHKASQGPHQAHQPQHHLESASLFHGIASSP